MLARSDGLEMRLQIMLTYQAAQLAHAQADYPSARQYYEQSLELAQKSGHVRESAWALINLGAIDMEQGELEAALARSQESLALFRKIGIEAGIAGNLRVLGNVAIVKQDYEAARRYFTEGLALVRQRGDEHGIVYALCGVAAAAHRQGDFDEARAKIGEALVVCRRLGQKDLVANALDITSDMENAAGRSVRAARLLGAAEALREALGVTILPVDRTFYDNYVGRVQTALGEEAFQRERETGRAMTLEQALDYALEPP